MKRNNKKGFTLIELLAVIVILAILATAAFTLVLPKINEARKKSFTSEVGDIVKAAELYCAEHDCDDISLDIYNNTNSPDLITDGYLQKQGVDASKWGGVVKVEKISGASAIKFEYSINFRNENFKTDGCVKYVDLTLDKVKDATDSDTVPSACN